MIELNWLSWQVGIWWHSRTNHHLQVGPLMIGRENDHDLYNNAGPASGEIASIYIHSVELRSQWQLDQWTIGIVAAREFNDYSFNVLCLSIELEIGKPRGWRRRMLRLDGEESALFNHVQAK